MTAGLRPENTMTTAGEAEQSRDEARTEIQNAVRQKVRAELNAARAEIDAAIAQAQADGRETVNPFQVAGAPQAPMPPEARSPVIADQRVIDALNAQIAAEKSQIEALTQQLTSGVTNARERVLTDQIEQAQERLSSLQAQLDRALGQRPVVPEAIVPGGPAFAQEMGQRAENMAYAFFLTIAVIAIGVPLARAFARWLDRRGHTPPAPATSHLEPRLERIEQAVEAIAIEIERISEGQRFTNKLMGEMRALPSPNALEQWPPAAAGEKQELRAK